MTHTPFDPTDLASHLPRGGGAMSRLLPLILAGLLLATPAAAEPTLYGWYSATEGDGVSPALFLRGDETPEQAVAQAERRWGDAATAPKDLCIIYAPNNRTAAKVFGPGTGGFSAHVANGDMAGWRWLEGWWPPIVEALDRTGYHVSLIALDIETAGARTWGGNRPAIVRAFEEGVDGLPKGLTAERMDQWPPDRGDYIEWNQWAVEGEARAWRRWLLEPAREAWGEDVSMSQYAWSRFGEAVPNDDRGWPRPDLAADGRTASPVLYGPPVEALALYDAAAAVAGQEVVPWVSGTTFRSPEHVEAIARGLFQRGCERILLWDEDKAGQDGAAEIISEVWSNNE